MNIRLNKEQEEAITRACLLEDLNFVDFMRLAAIKAAHETIDRYYVTRVTIEQADKMMEAIDYVKNRDSDTANEENFHGI